MNNLKDKFQNHKIQPSPKAWERIETELDRGKIRRLPINRNWAIAAMLAFATMGVFTIYKTQSTDNQDFTKVDKNPKIEVAPIATPKQDEVVTQNTTPVITNNETNKKPTRFVPQVQKAIFTPEQKQNDIAIQNNILSPIPQDNVVKSPTPKVAREQETVVFLTKKSWNLIDIKTKNVDIQRVTEDDDLETDEAIASENLNIKDLLKPSQDSTLTEKILNYGQQKARQVVAKAFKPVLKRIK